MLEVLFCFRGRIGRLTYFLSSFLLIPIAIAIIFLIFRLWESPGHSRSFPAIPVLIGMLVVALAMFWTSLSLQAARIRHIGWSPVLVIGGLFLVYVMDRLFAQAMPYGSLMARFHTTGIAGILNFFYAMALLFWPGEDQSSGPTFTFPEDRFPSAGSGGSSGTPAYQYSAAPAAAPATPSRPARRPSAGRGQQTSFGRRGLQ